MVIDLDTVVFKMESGMDGLPTAMMCILVKDEDDRTSLCAHDHSACANLEFGNLMVVNSLDVDGADEFVVGDQLHVITCNTTISAPVD